MMSDLRAGDKLTMPGQSDSYLEVLDGRIHAGTIHVFDAAKRESRYVDESGIRAKISSGSLILHRKGLPRVGIAAQYHNTALHAKVRFLLEILRSIGSIQIKLGTSFSAAIPLARENYIKESAGELEVPAFPSRASLFRAHKNQLLGLPVLKGDKNKGNTTARYPQDLVEFVQGVIQDQFLVTESKWTILDVTNYVNREARHRGLHLSNHAISRKFVASTIQGLTVDADYDRMDPLTRVAGKSFAKNRIRAPFPFSRIEQDALHLPFVVRTPHGVARTMYLVHAIDACTGYPVGWNLVNGSPREMDSLKCLEMYLTPAKAARFKELGVQHERNIFGTPGQLIFDNGPETKGGRIVRLELLGMDVKHCKAKQAQGKPFIERLNKSLKEALQRLEGSTRFEGKDGVRDPEALGDKLMTVEQLESWIVRWLYEDWVHTALDRLRWDELLEDSVKGKTPMERLNYMAEEMGRPITMPPPHREWMAALFEHRPKCTLSAKTGISMEHGFRYKGNAMSYLLAKYGDHAQLHIVFNPDDFREVYVYEGDELPLVTLTHEHVRPETPAWTFAEAKARFDAGMDGYTVHHAKAQFLRDLDDEVVGKSSKPRPRGKREENKETVRRSKAHLAVQRSVDRPLSSDTPFGSAPSANKLPTKDDVHPADVSYDDAPMMTIVNRTTGEKLL